MEQLFEKYTNLYNIKYKKNIRFSGSIKAYEQLKNRYYVCINLIVKYYDEIIYDFNKDFHINDKINSVFFNQYELIDIYNDIHNNQHLFNIE